MQISSSYEANNILDLGYISNTEKRDDATPASSGDRADISAEARELYSQMIHKYDQGDSQTGDNAGQNQGGSSAPSGGGSGDSETESVDDKIQSLKSQLASLAAQMTGGVGDQAVMSKMNALQAQIAALEAQKNA